MSDDTTVPTPWELLTAHAGDAEHAPHYVAVRTSPTGKRVERSAVTVEQLLAEIDAYDASLASLRVSVEPRARRRAPAPVAPAVSDEVRA